MREDAVMKNMLSLLNDRLLTIMEEDEKDPEDYSPSDEDWERLKSMLIKRADEDEEDIAACCGYDDDYGLGEGTIVCTEKIFQRIGAFIMSVFPFLRRKCRQCGRW